jgi:hypothetical protein
MIKRFLLVFFLPCLVLAQSESKPSPAIGPANSPQPMPIGSPPEVQPSETVVDEIERLLQERENAQAAAAAQLPPNQPRTHRYTNQPLSRVLRILAEQAGVNYIEPNFSNEERISVTPTNLTPLQAFYEIAETRGFEVVTDGAKYTLHRSDIEPPSFYLTKRYIIKNQPAEFLLQPIANFLGIKPNPAADNFPGYPKADDFQSHAGCPRSLWRDRRRPEPAPLPTRSSL